MIHHIVLLKLKPEVTHREIENLMVQARIKLLKIPEIFDLRCGKNTPTNDNPYDFFISMEYENAYKRRLAEQNPLLSQFTTQCLDPLYHKRSDLLFETEPGKEPVY
jgi:hypothetical protein